MSVTIRGSGQVPIQVVQGTATTTNGTSTASGTFVTTGLTVTITPQATTSKILILVNGTAYQATAGANNYFTVFRNGSNLNTGASPANLSGTYVNAASVIPVNIVYLDSPATVSACTYTVYFSVSGGTCQYPFNAGGGGSLISSITALEISGS